MATADFNVVDIVDPVPGSATFALATVLTVTAGAAAGDTAVAMFGSKGAGGDTYTVTDSKSNAWTVHTRSAQIDLATFVATSKLTTPLVAGDTITITGSTSRQKRSAIVKRVVGADVVDVVTADNLTGSTTSPSVTVGPSTQAADLAIGSFSLFSGSGAVTWPGMTGGSYVTTQQGTTDRTLAWSWQKNVAAGASVTFAPTVATAGFAWAGVAIMLKSAPDATTIFNATGTAVVTGTVSPVGAATITATLADNDNATYASMSPGSSFVQPLESRALPPTKTGWSIKSVLDFSGSGTITVDLLEGSTVRATWTPAISATPTSFTLPLTSTQAASLTSGTNLSLRYTAGA